MQIVFDTTLYSKRELLRLQELSDAGTSFRTDVLREVEEELADSKPGPFRYALLLLAADLCSRVLRYDETEHFLQQADYLFPPGTMEQSYYYLLRARVAMARKSYETALSILHAQLAREGLPLHERADFLLDICSAYRGTGAIKEALQTALELRTLWLSAEPQERDKAMQARAEHNVGNLYGELGRWEESLSHIEAALELYRQIGDINGQARGHNGIAVYFFMSSAYEVALESYAESERLYTSVGNELRALSVRGNMAMCYHEMGKSDEAIRCMKEVADGYHALGDLHNHARATINLAVILLDVDIQAAEQAVLAPELAPHFDVIMKGARALILASAACERGEYEQTVELARQTLDMCEQTGYDQYKQRALDLTAYALSRQGASENAYDFQVHAYRHARDQHRRQLEAQRRALTLKLQRERIEHERAMLRAEVEQKQKELAATTLKLVERSKLMGVVTQRLRDLHASVSDRNKSLVKETLTLIESQSGDVWEAFEQSFDGLTNQFFRVLAEHHSDLSPTEQRIAGLLRVGMSTKEMAAAMHISTRTVETHRYRLRKKLLRTGVTDLIAYLQQLGANGED